MIPSVTVKAGKKSHKLKISIHAQERLEEDQGKPIGELLNLLVSGFGGTRLVVAAWTQFLNDGAGVDPDEARQLLEDLGGTGAAAPYLGEAITKSFPELYRAKDADGSPGGDAGNAERPAA